ncbi:type VII secretion integral membrane protein EccD [Saccharomonospora sp. CUA-673]|uniref:type VII secretion integral membrane protein EccD n=1 Tax=Saccharomonospora sp. CUA-673 TaxID=1904969 RepID=UPI0009695F97|nr:type VII secretion integral membrane protein EccD [Saccharomonospora sp. CUA-673]OLT41314.1 type VII secretion integral membrane protein EccD [Saccharomonospora sp. CUA-673]
MATGTTVFSRVTVVAPSTRIDVALPADVAVADLMPMLLEMAKETSPDGGTRHGGWALAKLGDAPLDPSRTLASLGVVDGELLQLRKRSENPPPPLYDDVVDAIAEADPDGFRPWSKETALKIGHAAGGLAAILAAVSIFLGGILGADNSMFPLFAAIGSGIVAIACVALGATLVRAYGSVSTGVLVAAAGGLPMAFVAGFFIVPLDVSVRPNLLLGSALVVVVAAASIMIMGTGLTTFIAAATAGVFGIVTFLVATILDEPAPAIAAGTTAVALGCISMLPRTTIWLAKLPLPTVPGTADELKEDSEVPDYSDIEQRTSSAHNYMTGLLVGCGAVTAVAAMITATAPNIWGVLTGGVATAALLLRARTYANGSQAIALLVTGMVAAAGILVGWLWSADPFDQLLWGSVTFVGLAAAAVVLGAVIPHQRFSPPIRRTVDIIEAICIALVLPLALAVMELYSYFRHLDLLS